MRKLFADRFWSFVTKSPAGCWLWTGARYPAGYGMFGIKKAGKWTTVSAHRIAWELTRGRSIPAGKKLLHSCDNPPCVNPAHTFPGTQQQNIQDAARKGRLWMQTKPERIRRGANHPCHSVPGYMRGTSNPKSKLSERQVIAIRNNHARLKAAGITRGRNISLAREFAVSVSLIEKITRGALWSHL